MKRIIYLLLGFFVLVVSGQERGYVTVQRTLKLMETDMEVTVVALDEEIGYINIDEAFSEIKRIEAVISSWDETSETSLINKNAGIKPVKVSEELFRLIERSIQVSEITNGAFDISYAVMDKIWRFDGTMEYPPTYTQIKNAVTKIDYKKIILDKDKFTVFLKEKGMRIGFGGIGKGYAVDKAKELLVSKDVKAGMINASGDITAWGAKASGKKWLFGISDSRNKGEILSWIPIFESSVATSNVTDKYVVINKKKYSQVIDPKTGYPSEGINSISVFSKTSELCDALVTAIYVLGKEKGIALVNQLSGTEAILFDGSDTLYKSKGFVLESE